MALDKTDEEKQREANARAAMMNDLGISRIQEFPMDDRPRSGFQNQPINTQPVNRPPPRGNTKATRKEKEEQRQTEEKGAFLSAVWKGAISSGAFNDDDAEQVKGLDKIAGGRLHAQKITQAFVGAALGKMSQSGVVKKKSSFIRERNPNFNPSRNSTPNLSSLGIMPHGDAPVRVFKPGYATGSEAAKRPAGPMKPEIKVAMPPQAVKHKVPSQPGSLRHAISQPPAGSGSRSPRPATAGKGVIYQPPAIAETAPGAIASEPVEFLFRGDIAVQEGSLRGPAIVFICRVPPPDVGLFVLFHGGHKYKEYSIKVMDQPLAMSSEIVQTFKGENGNVEYAVRMIFRSQAQVMEFVRAFRLLLGEHSIAKSQPAAEPEPISKTAVSGTASDSTPHLPLPNEQPLAHHQKVKARLDQMMAGKALVGVPTGLRSLSRLKETPSREEPTLSVATERPQPEIVSVEETKPSTSTNVIDLSQEAQSSSLVDLTGYSTKESLPLRPHELVDITQESPEKMPQSISRESSYTDDLRLLSEPLSEARILDSSEQVSDAIQETPSEELKKTHAGASELLECMMGMCKIITAYDESEVRAMLLASMKEKLLEDPTHIEKIMSAMQVFAPTAALSRSTPEEQEASSSTPQDHHACDSSQMMEIETAGSIHTTKHAGSGEGTSAPQTTPSDSPVNMTEIKHEQPDFDQPGGSRAARISFTTDQMLALRDTAIACPERLRQLSFLPVCKIKDPASSPVGWTASRWDSPPETARQAPDLTSQIEKVAEFADWVHAKSSDKPKNLQNHATHSNISGALREVVSPKSLRPSAPAFQSTSSPVNINVSESASTSAQQNGVTPSPAVTGPAVCKTKSGNLGLGGSRWAGATTEIEHQQKFTGHTSDLVGLVIAASRTASGETKSSEETNSSEETSSTMGKLANDFRKMNISPKPETKDEDR